MRFTSITIFCFSIATMAGCQSNRPETVNEKSAMRTVTVGNPEENTAFAAILDATMGDEAGLIMTKQMDVTAQALGSAGMTGARIMRLAEGVKMTMNPANLFTRNGADLSADGKANLLKFAATLNEFKETDILIEGHTDGKGDRDQNEKLSQDRADAMMDYLISNGLSSSRISTEGYGDLQPLFSNETADGRKQNRRMEIVITGNENMKNAARHAATQRQ